jgi:catalase
LFLTYSTYIRFPQRVTGIKQRVRGAKFQEHYAQAQLFYNSLAPHEQKHLIDAISFELSHCDDPIVYENYSKILNNIDFNLAKQIATNVGGIVPDKPTRENHGKVANGLSQTCFIPKTPTIASRRIAILVADGFNALSTQAIRGLLSAGQAVPFFIGPRRGQDCQFDWRVYWGVC